ncbi:mersacidin/lichenicidin family type 2 lantibiotic [Archangium minus]|uniref:Mersacidin/lichenicidin family type 2 lantibiotic n=1 Tax=Archangium minus TaxID=83450 RepID=A0ABY9WY99_9BACT|nr:mersacidin/lichenicidin family type 2 lantibiotic [Archangium violaceum]WNG48126.1 mersacidin/lichenicidin family type 2 lantibiotic [Archangium minus]
MKKEMIVRAWKDPEYRAHLSEEQRAALPESPSGRSLAELGEAELADIFGGNHQMTREPTMHPRCYTDGFNCDTAMDCLSMGCI